MAEAKETPAGKKPRKRTPRKRAPAKKKSPAASIKEAKALVAEHEEKAKRDRDARETACVLEIKAALARHRCQLSPRVIVYNGQKEFGMDIIALDDE